VDTFHGASRRRSWFSLRIVEGVIQPVCQESISWEVQPVTADVARRDMSVFEGRSETHAAWVNNRVRGSYGRELRHGVPVYVTGDRRSMGLKEWRRKWVFGRGGRGAVCMLEGMSRDRLRALQHIRSPRRLSSPDTSPYLFHTPRPNRSVCLYPLICLVQWPLLIWISFTSINPLPIHACRARARATATATGGPQGRTYPLPVLRT